MVSVGAGVRIGQWTPFINLAQYREITTDPSYATQNYRRGSLTLRYDFSSTYSLKVQLDKYSEFHGTSFASDSTVLRLAFDMVF